MCVCVGRVQAYIGCVCMCVWGAKAYIGCVCLCVGGLRHTSARQFVYVGGIEIPMITCIPTVDSNLDASITGLSYGL